MVNDDHLIERICILCDRVLPDIKIIQIDDFIKTIDYMKFAGNDTQGRS